MKTRVLLSLALIMSAVCMNLVAQTPTIDPYEYPALNGGKYTLTNQWIYSVPTENFGKDVFTLEPFVAAAPTARHMAYWNGKLLISERGTKNIHVINAATGEVEDIIEFDFEADRTYGNSDILVDNAGNVLVANIGLSWNGYRVYKLDMETGEGTLLIDNYIPTKGRVDHISVLGDVNGDAVIFGPVGGGEGGRYIYRWTITDGELVSNAAEEIRIDYEAGGFVPDELFGFAPSAMGDVIGFSTRCYPFSEELVFYEGFETFPTLLYINGDEAIAYDSYYDLEDLTLPIPDALANDENTIPGTTLGMSVNCNGFAFFNVGDDYFFVRPVYNNTGVVPVSYRVHKYKDDNLMFREAEALWTFPAEGLGSNATNNGVYPVAVSVEDTKATIYIYAAHNGIAAYEFDTDAEVEEEPDGIKFPNAAGFTVYPGNKAIQFSTTVASAQVFSVTGQLIAKENNTAFMPIETPGVYVVKATALNGETVVSKVIIK